MKFFVSRRNLSQVPSEIVLTITSIEVIESPQIPAKNWYGKARPTKVLPVFTVSSKIAHHTIDAAKLPQDDYVRALQLKEFKGCFPDVKVHHELNQHKVEGPFTIAVSPITSLPPMSGTGARDGATTAEIRVGLFHGGTHQSRRAVMAVFNTKDGLEDSIESLVSGNDDERAEAKKMLLKLGTDAVSVGFQALAPGAGVAAGQVMSNLGPVFAAARTLASESLSELGKENIITISYWWKAVENDDKTVDVHNEWELHSAGPHGRSLKFKDAASIEVPLIFAADDTLHKPRVVVNVAISLV